MEINNKNYMKIIEMIIGNAIIESDKDCLSCEEIEKYGNAFFNNIYDSEVTFKFPNFSVQEFLTEYPGIISFNATKDIIKINNFPKEKLIDIFRANLTDDQIVAFKQAGNVFRKSKKKN